MKQVVILPNNVFTKLGKAFLESLAVRQRKVLNLSDCPDDFNCYYGEGYGQKTRRTISINLIAPHSSTTPGMLRMNDGHPTRWTVLFDGVVINRYLKKTSAISAIKRTLKEE